MVAIIGPGLDFSDKAKGYDVYPPQTIQPFALTVGLMTPVFWDRQTNGDTMFAYRYVVSARRQ
ncbi:MAG TPA: hypothetical protein VEL51_00540 [Vicinamibacterales bacterium]|nr:hypothetical protein [Vicinamibacterales bacterium]